MEKKTEIKEEVTVEVIEKKWYQKTWVIATGLIVTHVAAAAVGYVIGANSGDDAETDADPDQM